MNMFSTGWYGCITTIFVKCAIMNVTIIFQLVVTPFTVAIIMNGAMTQWSITAIFILPAIVNVGVALQLGHDRIHDVRYHECDHDTRADICNHEYVHEAMVA
jgi:hypothetical protein